MTKVRAKLRAKSREKLRSPLAAAAGYPGAFDVWDFSRFNAPPALHKPGAVYTNGPAWVEREGIGQYVPHAKGEGAEVPWQMCPWSKDCAQWSVGGSVAPSQIVPLADGWFRYFEGEGGDSGGYISVPVVKGVAKDWHGTYSVEVRKAGTAEYVRFWALKSSDGARAWFNRKDGTPGICQQGGSGTAGTCKVENNTAKSFTAFFDCVVPTTNLVEFGLLTADADGDPGRSAPGTWFDFRIAKVYPGNSAAPSEIPFVETGSTTCMAAMTVGTGHSLGTVWDDDAGTPRFELNVGVGIGRIAVEVGQAGVFVLHSIECNIKRLVGGRYRIAFSGGGGPYSPWHDADTATISFSGVPVAAASASFYIEAESDNTVLQFSRQVMSEGDTVHHKPVGWLGPYYQPVVDEVAGEGALREAQPVVQRVALNEDFTGAGGFKVGQVTVTPAHENADDGGPASRALETLVTDHHRHVFDWTAAAGQPYACLAYLRAEGGRNLWVEFGDMVTGQVSQMVVDGVTGDVLVDTTGAGLTRRDQQVARRKGGYLKIYLNVLNTAANAVRFSFGAADGTSIHYAGDDAKGYVARYGGVWAADRLPAWLPSGNGTRSHYVLYRPDLYDVGFDPRQNHIKNPKMAGTSGQWPDNMDIGQAAPVLTPLAIEPSAEVPGVNELVFRCNNTTGALVTYANLAFAEEVLDQMMTAEELDTIFTRLSYRLEAGAQGGALKLGFGNFNGTTYLGPAVQTEVPAAQDAWTDIWVQGVVGGATTTHVICGLWMTNIPDGTDFTLRVRMPQAARSCATPFIDRRARSVMVDRGFAVLSDLVIYAHPTSNTWPRLLEFAADGAVEPGRYATHNHRHTTHNMQCQDADNQGTTGASNEVVPDERFESMFGLSRALGWRLATKGVRASTGADDDPPVEATHMGMGMGVNYGQQIKQAHIFKITFINGDPTDQNFVDWTQQDPEASGGGWGPGWGEGFG